MSTATESNTMTRPNGHAADEPTRDYHTAPCREHIAFRAYAVSAAVAALSVAGYLYLRLDGVMDRDRQREVGMAAITARLDGIDCSLRRIEEAVAAQRSAATYTVP